MPKFITVTQENTKYFINVDAIQWFNQPEFIIGEIPYKTQIKLLNDLICCEQTTNEIMEMMNDLPNR